jgi:flagellar export protein FliJ
MAFVFRFEQLLRIAIHEEDEVKNRLSKKDGQIKETQTEIQKLKDEHAQGLIQKVEDLRAGNMSKIPMYAAYFARLKKNWEFHEEEMERLERQRERILQELIEKRRNRNMYEKMREKDQIKWKKEQLKKEQKRLDEFANRKKKTEELDHA